MRTVRVLITDEVHSLLVEQLRNHRFDVDYQPTISYEETTRLIPEYEGLIINSKIKCDKSFLDRAKRLEFVARLGSGREVVDLEHASVRHIKTFFSPDGNNNAVAEHALGMLLALANQLIWADRDVRQKNWQREARRGWELKGKTLGIIGFGFTGSQFAKKLSGLEINVLAHDKYVNNLKAIVPFVKETSKEQIQSQADIISFHLPWSEETHHYCNDEFLKGCKPGTVLINTSRGMVIDTAALVESLKSGHISGACLDVFENEKPFQFTPDEDELYRQLYEMKQVVLSPHIAGWTRESKWNMAHILLQKILNLYGLQEFGIDPGIPAHRP